MYLLVADETNRNPNEKIKFFIYGGVSIPLESAQLIHDSITDIRKDYGYYPYDELKFDSRSKPEALSRSQFTEAKNLVIDLADSCGVRFMAYVVHFEIASKDTPTMFLYALRTLLCHYDLFLERKEASGFFLADRFENCFDTFKEVFTFGIDPVAAGIRNHRNLQHVHLLGATCMGSTHFLSLVDVILGAFRYCVNEVDKTETPKLLYPKVTQLMLTNPADEQEIEEWGLFYRPRAIKSDRIRADYDLLRSRLDSLLSGDI